MVNICIRISPRLMSYICIKSKNASQKEEKWKENILNLSYNDIVMTRVHRVRTGKSLPPVSDKYWVGNFPMADKIPRTLKGFCKSTHEKLKFFTTWDNNSSQKKNNKKTIAATSIALLFIFLVSRSLGGLSKIPRSICTERIEILEIGGKKRNSR